MKGIIELLLFLAILNSCSRILYEKTIPTGISEGSVSIYNGSDQDLLIFLGEIDTQLDTFLIKKEETWISPTYSINPTIKLKTLKRTVKYQLELGGAYIILWNDKKKYWDINQRRNVQ